MRVLCCNRRLNLFRRCVVDMIVAQFQHRRGVAAPHAGRAQHADLCGVQPLFQRRFQRLRPGQFTRQRIADTDGQRGRRGLALFHHVEMRVETCDLINLGHRQAHFFCQGTQMRGREMAKAVLDQMQKLDQQVAGARAVAQQRANSLPSRVLHLPTLGVMPPLALAGFPDALLRFLPRRFTVIIQRHVASPRLAFSSRSKSRRSPAIKKRQSRGCLRCARAVRRAEWADAPQGGS